MIRIHLVLLCSILSSSCQKEAHSRKDINSTQYINMPQQHYSTTITADKDPVATFNAIANLRGWWSEQIDGRTDVVGETFFYHYKDIHLCKIKLIEASTGKKLVYEVTDNHFSFTKDPEEWKGTRLVFELTNKGDKTNIRFTHEGLAAQHECYEVCEEAWNNYIHESLLTYIHTGKGNPNPKDGEGYNAKLVTKWKLDN